MSLRLSRLEEEAGAYAKESIGEKTLNRALPTGVKVSAKVGPSRTLKDALLLNLTAIFADPDQPRQRFPETPLDELAESIAAHGVLMPIRVRPHEEPDKWYIVDGERRVRASRIAGKTTIPCIASDVRGEMILVHQLILNCQREDLDPLELGHSFAKLIEKEKWTEREAGKMLGKSQSHINKAITIAGLPEDAQKIVIEKKMGFTQAYNFAVRLRGDTSKPKPSARQTPFSYHTAQGRVSVVVKYPNATERDAIHQLQDAIRLAELRIGAGD